MRFPWQAQARSASSPSEAVNPLAGEVEIWLDGRRHVARLTLGALAGLEADLGAESMIALVERFEGGRFSSRDVMAVLVAGLRAGGWPGGMDALAAADLRGGPVAAAHAAAALLARAFRIEGT
ncbi:Phage tail tube protein, GTA-gp10 [Paracoccus thiocyanatus]|uniref:Phage tail tube protein, GTA-gp10 n=1 Tax=Paracoccus thiocyanatus TaxID=34006 RepID=A0A1N6PKZ3_9RHOB|nr:gene transfer agent family protein [Paracoccus thiocyanatus]SIQ04889.1 Phage tail tube protein, GTA-gp10 [Paracoccus thiocyanatus]